MPLVSRESSSKEMLSWFADSIFVTHVSLGTLRCVVCLKFLSTSFSGSVSASRKSAEVTRELGKAKGTIYTTRLSWVDLSHYESVNHVVGARLISS